MKHICILWYWNLQNMFELSFAFCISKKPDQILIFRSFMVKCWISPIFRKISQFSCLAFLWRHNYVTPWLTVLILVCMYREGPYLPIDTKINFIGVRFEKSREGVVTLPLVRSGTKNSLVRRGLMDMKMAVFWDAANNVIGLLWHSSIWNFLLKNKENSQAHEGLH